MNTSGVTPNSTGQNTSSVWLKQLGVAALYALFLYAGELFFESGNNVVYFEPASGLALAVLLLGGRRYAWGVFFGAALIHAITGDSLWESVTIAASDALQAFCGAWLLTRSGKFDLRLQSLFDYLKLILLGGVISVAIGGLAVGMVLQFSGLPAYDDSFNSLRNWWMSDTLGVILITPLILTWWQTKGSWYKTGHMIETLLLLALIILMCQIVFFDWLQDSVVHTPKAYWMFIPITWVGIRLGIREATAALFVVAVMGMFGAIHGTGYFAYEVAQNNLLNYWIFITTLSVVGMALVTHIVEHRAMEADLQVREASLRAILDNSPYLTWLKDKDGRYLMANMAQANYAHLKDYSEIIGKTDLDLWPKELAEKYRADDAEIIATRQQKHVEEQSFDGEKMHWVETYKTPIVDKHGNVLGTVGFVRDITERKQVEEALRIAAIAFETQEGLTVTDAHGVILRVNKAFTEITGYTAEEAIGKTPRILKSGRHDAAFYAAMWESLNHTGMWKGEIWNRRKNGEIYPEYHSITAVNGSNGEVTHYVGAMKDISNRKKAEAALVESHNLLNTVINAAPVRIFWKDSELRYLGCNPIFAKDAGEDSPQDVIGKNDRQLAWKEQAELYNADDRSVMDSGIPKLSYEEPQTTPDGKTIWLQTSKVPLRNACNETIGVLGVYEDITEQKRTQAEISAMLRRYRTLMQTSMDGIHIMDTKGNIVETNDAFCKMLGYTSEEMAGLNVADWEARYSADELRDGFKTLIGRSNIFETLHRRKDGTLINVEVSVNGVEMEGLGLLFASCRDITIRKKNEEEIHHLAFYDALTKLPNRRLFLDRFDTALTASMRHNNFGAVLFIDMDRFKLLNDTLGHDYGDLLLIEVAVRAKACVREADMVARLGGDEFVVLMENVSNDKDEAAHKVGLVAEKIRESLARPYNLNGHEHHSSPSIGVSLFRGNKEQVDELLQRADMAMYQAKDSGRNAVRFFDHDMQNNVVTRAELVSDLRCAITHQQLHLHYQLQVDNDNRPVGAETLLRWVHPKRGIVMPEQFLPIAEESTLIIEIGDWVLETACHQLALWSSDEKKRDLVLTVNISAKHFSMPEFVNKVAYVLQTHRVNPAHLKLELTENIVLNDLPVAITKMHALKALGVCLSMDDFGTRYSSLSNLKYIPLDQVKLGRNFVHDVAIDGNVALLVQSIIDMSSKYRITVIAEGVENESQLTSLKDRDCVAYQGFLFSKAVPVEEFERLLEL